MASWNKCKLRPIDDNEVYWHQICDDFYRRPEGEQAPLWEDKK
jgi:hypothetical protein